MVKLTNEQLAFVAKVNNGYKPGKAAMDAALKALPSQQKQIAAAIKRNAEMALRQANFNKAERERLARAKAARKASKKAKAEKPELLTANMRVDYAKAIKALAGKVANVMNSIRADESVKRERLERVYKELSESIAVKRARAASSPLVRVTYLSQSGYHQLKK